MFNISNKTLKYGLVSLVALVLIVSGVDYLITQKELSKIPQDLRINTDKDNIIGAQTIPNGKIYDKQDPTKVIYEGEVVKYAYKTDKIENKINEVVEKRTKHSRTIKVAEDKEKITYQLEVISGVPQYYEDEDGEWYQADYGTTDINTYALETKGSVLAQLFSPEKVYATEGTFYPDANPETNTVDGNVHKTDDPSWSTVRSAASGNAVDASGTTMSVGGRFFSPNYRIIRSYFLFDTSGLGTLAQITNATINLYILNNYAASHSNIVSSSPASNTDLVLGDYSQIGSVSFAQVAYTSIIVNAYNTHTLDSNGIANISKTGISKFGARNTDDLINFTPADDGNSNQIDYSTADTTGTSQDPKLVVTYTVPQTGTFFQMF